MLMGSWYLLRNYFYSPFMTLENILSCLRAKSRCVRIVSGSWLSGITSGRWYHGHHGIVWENTANSFHQFPPPPESLSLSTFCCWHFWQNIILEIGNQGFCGQAICLTPLCTWSIVSCVTELRAQMVCIAERPTTLLLQYDPQPGFGSLSRRH